MTEKNICNLTLEDIKELANLVAEKNLGKIDIKIDDSHVVIEGKKCHTPVPAPPFIAPPAFPQNTTAPVAAAVETTVSETKPVVSGNAVKSPIVGTFYAAPSPDKPPFVTVGQQVKKGDVLFIIESMKLMNEVQSEFDGVVKEILISNASPVEFDQPIMIIE